MPTYNYAVTGPRGAKYETTTLAEAKKLTRNGGSYRRLGNKIQWHSEAPGAHAAVFGDGKGNEHIYTLTKGDYGDWSLGYLVRMGTGSHPSPVRLDYGSSFIELKKVAQKHFDSTLGGKKRNPSPSPFFYAEEEISDELEDYDTGIRVIMGKESDGEPFTAVYNAYGTILDDNMSGNYGCIEDAVDAAVEEYGGDSDALSRGRAANPVEIGKWRRLADGTYYKASPGESWLVKKEYATSSYRGKRIWAMYRITRGDNKWRMFAHYPTLKAAKAATGPAGGQYTDVLHDIGRQAGLSKAELESRDRMVAKERRKLQGLRGNPQRHGGWEVGDIVYDKEDGSEWKIYDMPARRYQLASHWDGGVTTIEVDADDADYHWSLGEVVEFEGKEWLVEYISVPLIYLETPGGASSTDVNTDTMLMWYSTSPVDGDDEEWEVLT